MTELAGSIELLEDKTTTRKKNETKQEDTTAKRTLNEGHQKIARALSKRVASWFVRVDGSFYAVANSGRKLSRDDVKRISLARFKEMFPNTEIETDILDATFKMAIEEKTSDVEHSIGVWNGLHECIPGNVNQRVRNDGMVSLNTWFQPDYRTLGETGEDASLLVDFLQALCVEEADVAVMLDWLAWSLQNEADKPAWSLLLYSQSKGTGKSTCCDLFSMLFGRRNSMTQNSVEKLTSKFNAPLLASKLVISEEVQINGGSAQGNAMKTFITEAETTSERKGQEARKVKQYCCFLFTTNHYPHWIEAGDRRYYAIDCDHDGHASGPTAQAFGERVARLKGALEDPRTIAKIYNALMTRTLSNSFNPRSLNVSRIETPLMVSISEGSNEIQLERLRENLDETGVRAISLNRLSEICTSNLKINPNRLDHMMRELGWLSQRAKWGGKDYQRVAFVKSGYQLSRGVIAGPEGYREAFEPEDSKANPILTREVELVPEEDRY